MSLRHSTCLIFLLAVTAARAASFSAEVKNTKGGAVTDAVIWLLPLDRPAPAFAPNTAVKEIAQHDQQYSAYVTVVQAGSTVRFPNRDTVQHHVYSLSKAKKFELPLYNPGSAAAETFEVSGEVVLGCNIHDWMLAYVLVVPTPYYAQTEDGRAVISAPAGRYHLSLWHPRLAAAVTEEIILDDTETTHRDFTVKLKPDRRIRRGLVGRDSGYR